MDLIERIEHYDSFDAAVADCVWVLGFTARRRAAKLRLIDPKQAAAELLDARRRRACRARLRARGQWSAERDSRPRARHRHDSDDRSRVAQPRAGGADRLLRASPRRRRRDADDRAAAQGRAAGRPTNSSSMFFADAERSLAAIEFFKTRFPEHIMRTLRSLTFRAAPDARELSLLRAMVIEVTNYLNRRR